MHTSRAPTGSPSYAHPDERGTAGTGSTGIRSPRGTCDCRYRGSDHSWRTLVLSIACCRKRIDRLRETFRSRCLDAILITNAKHVYYFSGYLPPWTDQAALLVRESDV